MSAIYLLVMATILLCYALAFCAVVFVGAVIVDGLISAYWHLLRPLRARRIK